MIGDIQPTTTKLLDTRNNISHYLHFVSSQGMEGLRHHVVQLECCGPVSVYVQVVHDDEEEHDDAEDDDDDDDDVIDDDEEEDDNDDDVIDDHDDGGDQTARCQDSSLFTSRFYQTR